MPNREFPLLSLIFVVLAIAACAHNPADPAVTRSEAAATAAPTPPLNPEHPDDIIALGKRLSASRFAIFSVTQGKYTLFVGGVLNAEYETATAILRISSLDPAAAGIVCQYSSQGALFVDPKAASGKDAFVADCNRLARRLDDYLSR